jgi:hypothetical protein
VPSCEVLPQQVETIRNLLDMMTRPDLQPPDMDEEVLK